MSELKVTKKCKKSHFEDVDEAKKMRVMDQRKSENTNKATKLWVDLFNEYLQENNFPDVDLVGTTELPEAIENFYMSVRSKKKIEEKEKEAEESQESIDKIQGNDDCMYSNSSMRAMRAALNRHFKEKRKIDIISDSSFYHTNEIFKGLLKVNKQQGRGTVTHKTLINDEDLTKIFDYFKKCMANRPDPKKLQEILLFYIIYFTSRRGRENLRTMTKTTFKVSQDLNGRKFIYQALDKSNKNHDESDQDPTTQGRIYEIPDLEICPVWIFKLHISKLNKKLDTLWQRPKKFLVDGTEDEWYDNQVVGRDPLNETMKELSKNVSLSRSYTNHCIRASVVTQLDTEGFEASHIMAVSGHKSENSIKNYSSVCPDTKKRQFDALASKVGRKNEKETDNNTVKTECSLQQVPELQNKNFHLVPLFPDTEEDPIESDDFLIIIEQIEKENAQSVTVKEYPPKIGKEVVQDSRKTDQIAMNMTNLMNIQNVNRSSPFHHMFFPNSNVTINYNFK